MSNNFHVQTYEKLGIPLAPFNSVLESEDKDYYISYNFRDIDFYGDVTTALVVGQMEKFYILNGDHRQRYQELFEKRFEAYFDYFKQNISQVNKYSDKVSTDP